MIVAGHTFSLLKQTLNLSFQYPDHSNLGRSEEVKLLAKILFAKKSVTETFHLGLY